MTPYRAKSDCSAQISARFIEDRIVPILLGLDTGGTYTDAVLFDQAQEAGSAAGVLATAKSLTTKHDLAIGLKGAIEAVLPRLARRYETGRYRAGLHVDDARHQRHRRRPRRADLPHSAGL